MKLPYYNYDQRHYIIYPDTITGQMLLLRLAWKKLCRAIKESILELIDLVNDEDSII